MREHTVTNPEILAVFKGWDEQNFENIIQSRNRQPDLWDDSDYDSVSTHFTQHQVVRADKRSYLEIFGETPAGQYLSNRLLPILNFEKYSTAGYNPKGFIGWHDDHNITSHIVMITRCYSDQGYFRYLDTATGQVMTLEDSPGWHVRSGTIGRENETEYWHCAKTDAPRYTWIFHWWSKQDLAKAVDKIA